ncbi:MAG TPA: hydrogenase nickel incorporation protein HypB [Gallionella sp.]
MCTTCGCGGHAALIGGKPMRRELRRQGGPLAFRPLAGAATGRAHDEMAGDAAQARIVRVEQDILSRNDALAAANRASFAARGILALNLVSSPGSGKTTLLVKTLQMLNEQQPLAVIEGDQQTDFDAERIRATGVQAIQINTGKGCHLDASMVARAQEQLDLPQGALLFIENVGNLVCPAAFDLGEAAKVVVLSVTEGEDKPLKYPDMFRAAKLMLLNKCDLLPHLSFNVDLAIEYSRRINPELQVIRISAATGEGMDLWLEWLAAASRNAGQHSEPLEA